MATTENVLRGIFALAIFVGSAAFISAGGLEAFFGQADAEKMALELVPGEIQEVELESQNGELVYEVEILAGDQEKEVTINQQGQLLSVENEGEDIPITGNALALASQAALDYIGEGQVTDSEIGDEEGYYEIEITLDNGGEVDVHLDANFNVLSVEYD